MEDDGLAAPDPLRQPVLPVRSVASRPFPPTTPGQRRSAGETWGLVQITLAAAVLVQAWRVQDLFPVLGQLQLPSIVTLLAVAAFLSKRGVRSLLGCWATPVVKGALLILLLMVVGAPFGLSVGYSGRFVLQDHGKTVLVFLMLVGSIRSFSDVERFAIVQWFGALLYAVFVLLVYKVDPVSHRLGSLVYYDANDLGFLLVCVLPLMVYFVRPREKALWRILALASTGLFVLVIIKTGSRGAFLAMIAIAVYLTLAMRQIKPLVRLSWVAAAALMMTLMAGNKYWAMMRSIDDPNDYNRTAQAGRVEVWKRGIGYMLSHPLTGVGANAFPKAEGTISPLQSSLQDQGIGVKWSAAHNSFVQIGAELGFPGLLAFVLLLVNALKVLWRVGRPEPGVRGPPEHRQMAQALTGTLLAYVVAGFFLSQAYSAFMYAMFAIIAGLGIVVSKAAPKAQRSGAAPSSASRRAKSR